VSVLVIIVAAETIVLLALVVKLLQLRRSARALVAKSAAREARYQELQSTVRGSRDEVARLQDENMTLRHARLDAQERVRELEATNGPDVQRPAWPRPSWLRGVTANRLRRPTSTRSKVP
jgi:hypothetical protein